MVGLIAHYEFKAGTNSVGKAIWLRDILYSAKAFGVEKVVLVDVEMDYVANSPKTYVTLEEALAEFQGCEHVYLNPTDGTPLKDFDHPADNVVYIVGSDYSEFVIPPGATSVHIESVVPTELYATTAVGIVLYDRIR